MSYPGYRIEYGEATPSPGSPVFRGTRVRFSVTVRYVLQARPKGHLAMAFRGDSGDRLFPGQEVASMIGQGTGKTTLSQEVTIPEKGEELLLWIGIFPEGLRETSGALNIRYPVRKPPSSPPGGVTTTP